MDKILQQECRRRASRKLAATLLCQRRGIVADRAGNIMIYVNGYDRRCPAGNMKRIDAQTARHVKDRCPRLDLSDCTPDVISLLPLIRCHTDRLIVKASPMLDIKALIRDSII
mgnify:CR=1 FL=1